MQHDVKRMGHVLREARKAKGMTQAALAKETHTALRTIIAIENEKRFPTYEVFNGLSVCLTCRLIKSSGRKGLSSRRNRSN